MALVEVFTDVVTLASFRGDAVVVVTEKAGETLNQKMNATKPTKYGLYLPDSLGLGVVILTVSPGSWPPQTHAPSKRRTRRHDNIGDLEASPAALKFSGIQTLTCQIAPHRETLEP